MKKMNDTVPFSGHTTEARGQIAILHAVFYPKITFNAGCHSQTSDAFGTGHPASCLGFGYYKQNIGTWHVTTRTTPSQPHVFICPECVNDSLVLGIVAKQIAQRKEGMFP